MGSGIALVAEKDAHPWPQYCLQFASENTILCLDQQVKVKMLDISLMLVA
jgi:hypothetical protein